MNVENLLWIAVGGLAVFVGLAVGAWAYPRLKKDKQGYPLEDQIEAALLPFLFYAICSAYKASESIVADVGEVMDGADKKRLADYVYDLLPDNIGGFPIGIVKGLITRERFSELVQSAYDDFDARYHEWQGSFPGEFEKWLELNQP